MCFLALHKFEEAETSDDGESRVYFSPTVPVLDKEVNSTSRLFTNKKGECYPIATAIISVEKGVVKTITWDNDCYNCNESCDAVSVYRKDGELTIISEDDPSYKLWYSSACTTQICDHLHVFPFSSSLFFSCLWCGPELIPITFLSQVLPNASLDLRRQHCNHCMMKFMERIKLLYCLFVLSSFESFFFNCLFCFGRGTKNILQQ